MENYTYSGLALTTPKQVAQVADRLTLAADVLHRRLLFLIRSDRSIDESAAQALFDAEVTLRQQANSLYADAADYTITGLDLAQESITAVVDAAQQRMAHIEQAKELINVGIKLLALATAVASSKPEAILNALKKMHEQLGKLGQNQAAPAA